MIMKTTYLKPTTDVLYVTVQQMIAASNSYGQPEQGQDLTQAEETTETSGNLGRRRRDIWEDEEEEEQF